MLTYFKQSAHLNKEIIYYKLKIHIVSKYIRKYEKVVNTCIIALWILEQLSNSHVFIFLYIFNIGCIECAIFLSHCSIWHHCYYCLIHPKEIK